MAVNGIRHNIIPRDDVFIDYLWYRSRQVNNGSITKTPDRFELNKQLQNLAITEPAKKYMQEFDIRNKNDLNVERWINTISTEFEKNCLKQDDFRWLEGSPRQLCYIWRWLSHLSWEEVNKYWLTEKMYKHHINTSIQDKNKKKSTKHYVGMHNVDNHTVTKHDIICFINRLNNTKHEKVVFIEDLRGAANKTLKNKDMTNWFANDRTPKEDWLNHYLDSSELGYTSLIDSESGSPMNDLISFLDVLHTFNEDKYKWIVINIRKTWNQRTYRERNKTKKQYSINMSNDIGKILDELSRVKRKNKNAIVEELIRAEYDEITRP
ncbi:hypothetical protein [Aeromonas caviae]|uniref:hypothetical protein n=1 Tax=Aeromonas caviae TaxID=648 RepID=UPI001FB90D9C|nr:hypothetical protein [Aeromonas caviae]MDT8954557.1 hypothetical protein [Aeromonas caviae]GKR03595.1 hypothetical protein KAM462_33150 [Aeromonas caviae]GKR10193.1 hypothetical protein KAM465_17700 [Aeromonas caviae]GKR13838.1 hypothetical protein KAM466_11560 [Aeromonas caviae]GKR17916.1 hypothetical protein KAM467_09600 [Aeromonas caviae]